MFKKTLSTRTLAAMMLLGGLSFTQLSCSQDQQRDTAQTGDRAYNNFKGFVDQTEASATNVAQETQADYDRETAQMKADFDAQVASVDSVAGQYDDQRRQEIEQLRNRYTAAYDKRETAWRSRDAAMNTDADGSMSSTADNDADYGSMGKYYKPTKNYANVSAAGLPAVYKQFTDEVNKNKSNYDIADWRNVNSDWKRLNARKDELDPTLSGDAKTEIAKQKVEYAAVKSYDKTELRVEQGADAVAGTAKDAYKGAKSVGKEVGNKAADAGEKVGDKAADAGKDVGQKAAKVGSKIGNTAANVGEGAADVGKDAYKGAKKGVKKVGSAIGDVFDGKDKKDE